MTFSQPETLQVTQKLVEVQETVEKGKFMPDRENDPLVVALGNKEHPGGTRSIGVKVPWKEGFTKYPTYKSCKRYEERKKKEAHKQFREWYTLEKEKERAAIQDLCSPCFPSSVASGGGVESFGSLPVDVITEMTPCKLHVLTMKGFSVEVATGTAYPGHD